MGGRRSVTALLRLGLEEGEEKTKKKRRICFLYVVFISSTSKKREMPAKPDERQEERVNKGRPNTNPAGHAE